MQNKSYKFLLLMLLFVFSFLFFACSSLNKVEFDGSIVDATGDETGLSISGKGSEGYMIEPSGVYTDDVMGEYIEGREGYNEEKISPRTLTAKALFDHNNYDYWLGLLTSNQDGDGEFKEYHEKFGLPANRIEVKINGGAHLKVRLLNGDDVEWEAYCDSNGLCYLFNQEKRDKYEIELVFDDSKTQKLEIVNGEEITISEGVVSHDLIQLMFVIDTTGSMGDEIDYLKVEIANVINRVKEANDNVTIHLALLFYRDYKDDYLTRYFDFTSDIQKQVENLGKQSANGGGDYEEAIHEAFALAAKAQWNEKASTKILVHVADAPSHNEDVKNWFSSVKTLASKGVRIINVASSGVDKLTEYLFRSQCIQTNGCYAFLTNHSGIGNNHIEASSEDDLVVEYLNDLLVRVINGMYSGEYADAVPFEPVTANEQTE